MGTGVSAAHDHRDHPGDRHADQAARCPTAWTIPPGTGSGCPARRAPTDLRMPISRVRSVTTASMMFMITTPPTTMNTETTADRGRGDRARQLFPGPISESDAIIPKCPPAPASDAGRRAAARGLRPAPAPCAPDRCASALYAEPAARRRNILKNVSDRDDHEIVLRLAENAALRPWPRRSLRSGRPSTDNRLADRIDVREELGPSHRCRCTTTGICRRSSLVAMNRPAGDLDVRDRPHVGGDAGAVDPSSRGLPLYFSFTPRSDSMPISRISVASRPEKSNSSRVISGFSSPVSKNFFASHLPIMTMRRTRNPSAPMSLTCFAMYCPYRG